MARLVMVAGILVMVSMSLRAAGLQHCYPIVSVLLEAQRHFLVDRALICADPSLRPYRRICLDLLDLLPSIGLKSPMRSEVRVPRIIYEVVETNRSSGFRSQVCSLPVSGIEPGALLFVCLDLAITEFARRLGANVILLNVTLYSVFARYCLRFVIDYILACLGFESFLIDSDIIFFGRFLSIWDFRTDLEVTSDWPWPLEAASIRPHSHVNGGLRRCTPKAAVVSLFLSFLRYANRHGPLWGDQPIIDIFLRRAVLISVNYWRLSAGLPIALTYSFVDPFKVPCGALLLCIGRDALCSYSMAHGILSPIAIHLNWHSRESDKAKTLGILNLTCPGPFIWPFWRSCQWPVTLTSKCKGFDVSYS
jgi:hypothetical protein